MPIKEAKFLIPRSSQGKNAAPKGSTNKPLDKLGGGKVRAGGAASKIHPAAKPSRERCIIHTQPVSIPVAVKPYKSRASAHKCSITQRPPLFINAASMCCQCCHAHVKIATHSNANRTLQQSNYDSEQRKGWKKFAWNWLTMKIISRKASEK